MFVVQLPQIISQQTQQEINNCRIKSLLATDLIKSPLLKNMPQIQFSTELNSNKQNKNVNETKNDPSQIILNQETQLKLNIPDQLNLQSDKINFQLDKINKPININNNSSTDTFDNITIPNTQESKTRLKTSLQANALQKSMLKKEKDLMNNTQSLEDNESPLFPNSITQLRQIYGDNISNQYLSSSKSKKSDVFSKRFSLQPVRANQYQPLSIEMDTKEGFLPQIRKSLFLQQNDSQNKTFLQKEYLYDEKQEQNIFSPQNTTKFPQLIKSSKIFLPRLSLSISTPSQIKVEENDEGVEKRRVSQFYSFPRGKNANKCNIVIQSMKQKFKRGKLRLRILLGFWNKMRKAIINRREDFQKLIQSNGLTDNLINDVQTLSMKMSKQSLQMLLNDDGILDYYNRCKDRQSQIAKQQKLVNFVLNIANNYVMSSMYTKIDQLSLMFISMHTRNYSHLIDQVWPKFILIRLEFTQYGQIKNLTPNQCQMMAIYYYFIHGICNGLINPWEYLQIEKNLTKERNVKLAMSVIFYMVTDYIKQTNPIIKHNPYFTIPQEYQPKASETPFNAYEDVLAKDRAFQEFSVPSQTSLVDNPNSSKIVAELSLQKSMNENTMIGLHPRRDLEGIVSKDEKLKNKIHSCFQKGTILMLQKITEFNMNFNERLFDYLK